MDGYNWGTSIPREGRWRSPSAVFVPTLNALKRLAPTKPVMIAETASAEQGGNKADWITDLFTLLQHYPEVKAVAWFNYANGPTDWQITSSKSSVQAMATSLSSDWQAEAASRRVLPGVRATLALGCVPATEAAPLTRQRRGRGG